jgi:hypothetical protein
MPIDFPSSPTNGQVVSVESSTYTWNNTAGTWDLTTSVVVGPTGPTGPVGATGPAGEGVTSISLLTDVELTSVADGDVLLYSATAAKWINVSLFSTLMDFGAIHETSGGSYNTSAFAGTIDGGLYNTTEFASIVDGGNEGSF